MDKSAPDREHLASLKKMILMHVLTQEPLPGSHTAVTLPDLPFILAQSDLYLLDETLKENIYVAKIRKTVQLVTSDFLTQIADQSDQAIYFQFQTTSLSQGSLLVYLETKILASASDNHRIVTLSSLQLNFQEINGEWLTAGPSASLSA